MRDVYIQLMLAVINRGLGELLEVRNEVMTIRTNVFFCSSDADNSFNIFSISAQGIYLKKHINGRALDIRFARSLRKMKMIFINPFFEIRPNSQRASDKRGYFSSIRNHKLTTIYYAE